MNLIILVGSMLLCGGGGFYLGGTSLAGNSIGLILFVWLIVYLSRGIRV